jgi:hypothetical protein
MIRKTLCPTIAALAVGLFVAAPCFADLFAVLTPQTQIVRIDSATGSVTQTYPIPDFFPASNSTTSGLAFDGEVLYLSQRLGNFDWLLRYDVSYDFWYPPSSFLPTLPNPTGEDQPISGLGIISNGFGGGDLIAVTRKPSTNFPSNIYQYQVFGPGPDMVFPDGNNPVGTLPLTMDAHGADVDAATGELWITATEFAGGPPTLRLLHTDISGNVLNTLPPALGSENLIRGLGFDNGSMFIAGRNLPTSANYVYEINRTNGTIVRSFALPGTGNVAALTGGTVFNPVPEPRSLVLVVIGFAIALGLRQR